MAPPQPWQVFVVNQAPPSAGGAGGARPPTTARAAQRATSPGLNTAANIGSDLARNDNLGVLTSAADVAAGALGKIPVVGTVLEGTLKGITAGFTAASSVIDAFVSRGKELSGYSGELASANADAEVRSLMSDIREAQELGPELANLTEQQSKFSSELRELLLPIKKVVVDILAGVLEGLRNFMGVVVASFASLKDALDQLGKIFSAVGDRNFTWAMMLANDMKRQMGIAFDEALAKYLDKKEDAAADHFLDMQLRDLQRQTLPMRPVFDPAFRPAL